MDTAESLMESLIKQIARKMLDCLSPPAVEPPPHRLALNTPEICLSSNSNSFQSTQRMHNLSDATPHVCTCNLCPYKFQKELPQTDTNANLNVDRLRDSESVSQLNYRPDYLLHLNANTDAMEIVGNGLEQNINKCVFPIRNEMITNTPDVFPSSSSALNVKSETQTHKGIDEPLYNCQLEMNENKNIVKINVQSVSSPDRCNTEITEDKNSNKVGKIFLRKLKEMTEIYNLADPRTVEEYPQQESHVEKKQVATKKSLSSVSVQGNKKKKNRKLNKIEWKKNKKIKKAAKKYFQESMASQCCNDVLQKDRQNEKIGKIFLDKRKELTEIYNLPSNCTIEDYPPQESNRMIAPITSTNGKKRQKKRKKGKKNKIVAAPNQPKTNKMKDAKVNRMIETQSVKEECVVTEMFTNNVGDVVQESMVKYRIDTYYTVDS